MHLHYEQEHGAELHQKQVESHQLSQSYLAPCHCSQLRPRNSATSYQETNICKAKAKNVCHTFLSSIQTYLYCYHSVLFSCSHLLPPTQSFSLIYQAAWFQQSCARAGDGTTQTLLFHIRFKKPNQTNKISQLSYLC